MPFSFNLRKFRKLTYYWVFVSVTIKDDRLRTIATFDGKPLKDDRLRTIANVNGSVGGVVVAFAARLFWSLYVMMIQALYTRDFHLVRFLWWQHHKKLYNNQRSGRTTPGSRSLKNGYALCCVKETDALLFKAISHEIMTGLAAH